MALVQTHGNAIVELVCDEIVVTELKIDENTLIGVCYAHVDTVFRDVVASALDIVLQEFSECLYDVTFVGFALKNFAHFFICCRFLNLSSCCKIKYATGLSEVHRIIPFDVFHPARSVDQDGARYSAYPFR
jgi:hypothetical protein